MTVKSFIVEKLGPIIMKCIKKKSIMQSMLSIVIKH
jgi:hypothetical protein